MAATKICLAIFALISLQPAFALRALQQTQWNGPKIVCTGWKKTGTSSIRAAFELFHIKPVNGVGHITGMDHFGSAEDYPQCCKSSLIQKYVNQYPKDKMKFVHLERDPEKWHKTTMKWMHRWPKKECAYSSAMGVYPKRVSSPQFLEGYKKHNARIREIFKDDPDRLLILNLEEGDSVETMQKFCEFVGLDNTTHTACNRPFPHNNGNRNNKKTEESFLESGAGASEEIDWDWIDADDDADEDVSFDESKDDGASGVDRPAEFALKTTGGHCTNKQPGKDQHKPVGASKGGKVHFEHEKPV